MPLNLPRPTFGVEVEFLVATLPRDGNIPDPHGHIPGLPPALRWHETGIDPFELVASPGFFVVMEEVKGLLSNLFGKPPRINFALVDVSGTSVLTRYSTWEAEHEATVYSQDEDRHGYRFYGMEVISPVQYPAPKAFEMINIVVSIITSKFRCIVNMTCGLHVHVGLGEERIPLEGIRRIGSLSYAVEPLLFALHNPRRRADYYCKPLEYQSRLATGRDEPMFHDNPDNDNTPSHGGCLYYFGRERRHGEFPISAREQDTSSDAVLDFARTRKRGHFEPFIRAGDQRPPAAKFPTDISHELDLRIAAAAGSPSTTTPEQRSDQHRTMPRIRLLRDEPDSVTKLPEHFKYIAPCAIVSGGPASGVFEATRRIYEQPASCSISHQLSGHGYSAINFDHYGCTKLVPSRYNKRTIEFRMGEGTLDADWIPVWAKICTGLFKFALYASPSDFIDVLTNCDKARKESGSYDVVDLLNDIGLFAEAEAAQQRLKANKDRWNLKFVESKEPRS
ncbi:hypothetical protein SAMD00023353_5700180 [Rosellinia necatrix]|uniref:Amidoligase enzyme n=1 Tax=Rosellinia necatrix TaxID=77044 RepID=A0A1W2TTT5_ROSNE|nr:hypothetical protein SAMD00023353_5700180 [Rosellinia necatrix]